MTVVTRQLDADSVRLVVLLICSCAIGLLLRVLYERMR